jgi:hypothetical protein
VLHESYHSRVLGESTQHFGVTLINCIELVW